MLLLALDRLHDAVADVLLALGRRVEQRQRLDFGGSIISHRRHRRVARHTVTALACHFRFGQENGLSRDAVHLVLSRATADDVILSKNVMFNVFPTLLQQNFQRKLECRKSRDIIHSCICNEIKDV